MPARARSCLSILLASLWTLAWSWSPEMPAPEAAGAQVLQRGLWVYKPAFLADTAQRDRFLAFVAAHHVDTLFLSASKTILTATPDVYAQVNTLAHQQGLSVQALNGAPDWMLDTGRPSAAAFLQLISDYNRAATTAARFDAVHLDVEPNALPGWNTGSRALLESEYIDFLKWCAPQVRAQGLPLAVDLPTSMAGDKLGSVPVLDLVLANVDQGAVMDYKNSKSKVVTAALPFLAAGDRTGKKVWVGVSADPSALPVPAAGETQAAAFERMVNGVESSLSPYASFAGMAIFDYARYSALYP